MCVCRIAAIFLISSAGCIASRQVPADGPERNATPAEKQSKEMGLVPLKDEGDHDRSLWDTDLEVLNTAFRKFAAAPGTTPAPRFVTLELRQGQVRFATVPPGWEMWNVSLEDVREIVYYQNGFRSYLSINQGSEPPGRRGCGQTELRDVKCSKGKGNTIFTECRHIPTAKGWVAVELTVMNEPGGRQTTPQLLAHLREHYGKYQGVCQQVRELAIPK